MRRLKALYSLKLDSSFLPKIDAIDIDIIQHLPLQTVDESDKKTNG